MMTRDELRKLTPAEVAAECIRSMVRDAPCGWVNDSLSVFGVIFPGAVPTDEQMYRMRLGLTRLLEDREKRK